MKGGHTPIHIQRFAPADLHADEHVQLLEKRLDYLTLNFYRCFIDYAFMAGGDLPADLETLASIVKMPEKDVEKALAFCLGRLVFQDGDRLYQPRVRRDIAEELRFRDEQAARGKLGGRPKKEATALNKDAAAHTQAEKPPLFMSKSPPASASSPSSAPAPAPTVIKPTAGDDGLPRYVTTVLELYCRLPGTREQPTRADRKTAAGLYQDGYSIDCVRTGLLMATARRELRNREQPLPPIGSLAYFTDAIEEARASPPDEGYVGHLAARIEARMKGESHVEAEEDHLPAGEAGEH